MRTLALVIVLTLVPLSLAHAQEPAPASGDATSTAVVGFFTDLAALAANHKDDCGMMGAALNDHLNANEKLLRDAAYSNSVAPPDQEMAILNAATNLGEAAGTCYEEPIVATFFERLVKLATELDTGS